MKVNIYNVIGIMIVLFTLIKSYIFIEGRNKRLSSINNKDMQTNSQACYFNILNTFGT